MKAVVYRSSARIRFSQRDLVALVDHAKARNRDLGVTGYLVYRNGIFLQYLEGPDQAVTDLMKKIAADPRHEIEMRVWWDTARRRLPAWTMRNLTLEGSSIDLEDIILQSLRLSDPRVRENGEDASGALLQHQIEMLCHRLSETPA